MDEKRKMMSSEDLKKVRTAISWIEQTDPCFAESFGERKTCLMAVSEMLATIDELLKAIEIPDELSTMDYDLHIEQWQRIAAEQYLINQGLDACERANPDKIREAIEHLHGWRNPIHRWYLRDWNSRQI
ncbi:MAG: hypothetical protein WCW68_01665 [Methanothrix sp.]|jgi:hypothetical protein